MQKRHGALTDRERSVCRPSKEQLDKVFFKPTKTDKTTVLRFQRRTVLKKARGLRRFVGADMFVSTLMGPSVLWDNVNTAC